jgi:hypothetical protein
MVMKKLIKNVRQNTLKPNLIVIKEKGISIGSDFKELLDDFKNCEIHFDEETKELNLVPSENQTEFKLKQKGTVSYIETVLTREMPKGFFEAKINRKKIIADLNTPFNLQE